MSRHDQAPPAGPARQPAGPGPSPGTRLAPGSTASEVAARLRRTILDGEYSYQDRLPPERALAERFGVARGTVRAALRQLQDIHLITRRTGSGTYVRYRGQVDAEGIAELTTPLELVEVRLAIEPSVARLAVMNANAHDLARMRASVERVEAAGTNAALFSRADEAFHLSLAESTHNPLMIWLYRQINEIREHAQWSTQKDSILTPQRILEYNTQHRALYTAITRHDIEGAVGIMRTHLRKARADLLGEGSR